MKITFDGAGGQGVNTLMRVGDDADINPPSSIVVKFTHPTQKTIIATVSTAALLYLWRTALKDGRWNRIDTTLVALTYVLGCIFPNAPTAI